MADTYQVSRATLDELQVEIKRTATAIRVLWCLMGALILVGAWSLVRQQFTEALLSFLPFTWLAISVRDHELKRSILSLFSQPCHK